MTIALSDSGVQFADGTTQPTTAAIAPINSQAAGYTCVYADMGKVIYPTSTGTFTIPANASVAYPTGTVLTFINMQSAGITIAITSDTMYWSNGGGLTGSRGLAQYGIATAIKLTATTWLISGTGLS